MKSDRLLVCEEKIAAAHILRKSPVMSNPRNRMFMLRRNEIETASKS